VLIIGIDGATLRVVQPLFEQGRLPNLRRLADEGASGPLLSAFPLSSARIWATIATGKVPEKHGIVDFTYDDAQGVRHLFLSSDRRVHALWNITSDAGLETAVVNWWTTYPPERIDGVMVTDHVLKEVLEENLEWLGASPVEHQAPVVYPESWYPAVVAASHDHEPLTGIPNMFRDAASLPKWFDASVLARTYEQDGFVTRVALQIEREMHPRVTMLFLKGIDRVQHFLWGTLEDPSRYPEHLRGTPEERAAGRAALEAYYDYTDALIGRLLEGRSGNDLVLVVSDHGFEFAMSANRITGSHYSKLAQNGVAFLRGSGIAPGTSTLGMTVNDVTPTVLAWLDLPVAEDMDGRPAPFVGAPPTRWIPTYDTKPVDRIETSSQPVEGILIDELKSLGYIE